MSGNHKQYNGEGGAMDAVELPNITAKQRGFVEGILEGKTASDAYRGAYNAENMSNEAIWVEASRLQSSPNVRLWVDKAREVGAKQVGITAEWWNREALQALQEAREDKGHTAVKGLLDSIAKVNGVCVGDRENDKPGLEEAVTGLVELLNKAKRNGN